MVEVNKSVMQRRRSSLGEKFVHRTSLLGGMMSAITPNQLDGIQKNSAAEQSKARSHWKTLRAVIAPPSREEEPAVHENNPGHLKKQVILVLSKKPAERRKDDIEILYNWINLQDDIALLSCMSEVTAKALCKEMGYVQASPRDVIIHQGAQGDHCYILLAGVGNVHVRSGEQQEAFGLKYPATADSDLPLQLPTALLGHKVATLEPGAVFGELALVDKYTKRTATIVAEHGAKLISINESFYNKLLRNQKVENGALSNTQILKQLYPFLHWKHSQILRIAARCKLNVFESMQFICRQDQEADAIHIILSGQVREWANIAVKSDDGGSAKIKAQVTFLGRFDFIGTAIASSTNLKCLHPVDVLAVGKVTTLSIGRRTLITHVCNRSAEEFAAHTLNTLKTITHIRQAWRSTRIDQIKEYPHLNVPITRKMMRLGRPLCTICGKRTHIAGDRICSKTYSIELALTPVIRAMKKNLKSLGIEHRLVEHRRATRLNSVLQLEREAVVRRESTFITCPRIGKKAYKSGDHGRSQIDALWKRATKTGLSPRPPCSAQPRKSGGIVRKLSISSQIQEIRNAWPRQLNSGDNQRE